MLSLLLVALQGLRHEKISGHNNSTRGYIQHVSNSAHG